MSKILFDTHGNDKQKECAKYWIDDTTSQMVFGGSKASGKSFLGASLIFGDAFIYPGTHFFIARKKLNDLRKYTKPSIQEVFDIWGVNRAMWRYDGNDNFYELHNGSRVYLLEAAYQPSDPDYERFGSMQMTRGWCEELGEFDQKALENLSASTGRWLNKKYNLSPKVLGTCNPTRNFLFRLCLFDRIRVGNSETKMYS